MKKNEILVIHGKNIIEMTKELVKEANLSALIGEKSKKIGLKPNLVIGSPAKNGATTHPEIAAGIIEYLKENGISNIVILEGSWVGARTSSAFRTCGYTDLAEGYGVGLVDLQQDKTIRKNCAGMDIDICQTALSIDFMINLPVMKGHCQTVLTCALKNNKGVISNNEKRNFHAMGLHRPIAHLNTVAKNDFIVVDAICGDLDFEEGGNPIQNDMLFAAMDPVLCDSFAASRMGLSLEEIPYIAMAEKLGVGSSRLDQAKIRALNDGKGSGIAAKPSGRARRLAEYVSEDSSCSACFASLIRALSRADGRTLKKLPAPICIGQGFQNKSGAIGVGRCTAGFEKTVGGCPPSADEILKFIENL